jgi:hypothetical protein
MRRFQPNAQVPVDERETLRQNFDKSNNVNYRGGINNLPDIIILVLQKMILKNKR